MFVFKPLRVEIDDYALSTIEDILQSKNDKEDLLRTIFQSAKSAAMNITDELLADFRRQKSLGKYHHLLVPNLRVVS